MRCVGLRCVALCCVRLEETVLGHAVFSFVVVRIVARCAVMCCTALLYDVCVVVLYWARYCVVMYCNVFVARNRDY